MIELNESIQTFHPNSLTTIICDFLVRTFLKLAFPASLLLSRFDSRPYHGALVIIRIEDDVLLLKSSYRQEWNLPGGQLKPGENASSAALREIKEELGVELLQISPLKVICGEWRGRKETVHFFESRLIALPKIRIDNREIVDWKFVPMRELSCWKMTDAVQAYFASAFQ
jgi:8-oxo-dGTP pyrophosphatase MutT (NUDIX family)